MKQTKNIRKAGFTLVEIMIVVAIIGLLAAIAIPNFVKARATAQANACINNLRQLDAAKQQWALETGKSGTDTPNDAAIMPYLGHGTTGDLNSMYCPLDSTHVTDTSYSLGDLNTAPTCKINGTGQKDANSPHALPTAAAAPAP
jgi:prepilin-type N-terminal cleavage/methylation domain-containing protein